MKIFYITYWGVKDGLSVSTVYPNLSILSQMEKVESIDYFTVERDDNQQFKDALPPMPKLTHHPIQSKKILHHLITKILDWRRINQTILKQARKVKPDLVICRGAMSGPVGSLLYKKLAIPYVVESFEPHADYMLESKVWKEGGLKHSFQAKKEAKIKKTASALITVSHNYANYLIQKEQIAAKRIYTVPCFANTEKFGFNAEKRTEIQKKLNIAQKVTTAIYLGKFGGMYYDKEAFQLFKASYDYFKEQFFLILLCPQNKEEIEQKLKAVDFPLDHCWIGIVPHAQVPHYLSVADFAYNLHAPGPTRIALSPIKNGEYWANGLPILISDGIGDDSDIIKREGGGAIVDVHDNESVQKALSKIETIIRVDNHRDRIKELAIQHRNPVIGEEVYHKIIQTHIQNSTH